MRIAKRHLMYGFFFAASISLALLAAPPGVRIGGYSLRANGQVAQGFEYSGPCPVALKFGWSLQSERPTDATYAFERNDGSRPPGGAIRLEPGRSGFVYMDWHMGANTPRFANYHGFAQLNVVSPNVVSQKINFTLHCGG